MIHRTDPQPPQPQPEPLTLEALAAQLAAFRREVEVRLDSIDAWIDGHSGTHDRQGEIRDRELSRLRDELRQRESDIYGLERQVSSLQRETQQARRGW